MNTQHDKIHVLLVDDYETIHVEISALLADLDDVELVAMGYNGEEAVQLCSQHRPDVILMDISMPVMNGIEATKVILERHPETRIVALSGLDDMKTVQDMIAAGAVGYVLKESHPEQLMSIIRAVYGGQSVFSTHLMRPLLKSAASISRSPRDYGLTRREMDILGAMSYGLNNNEVADRLNISPATVRFHLKNIIQKLGADNRMEALIIATRQKLI